MLKIITVPDKILNQPVKIITKFDQQLQHLIKDMEKTLIAQNDPPGVGLAAPQVGENLAIFLIKPDKQTKTEVFINPKIVKISQSRSSLLKPAFTNVRAGKSVAVGRSPLKSVGQTGSKSSRTKLEGCLSIPRIWGPIKRAEKILLKYQDLSGKNKTQWFSGFKAVIVQHEMDHLNGILFTQRSLEQNQPLYEEKAGELEKIYSIG